MRSVEAKAYFTTLGTIHAEQRRSSPIEAASFLEQEKGSQEYAEALLSLKLANGTHFRRGYINEQAMSGKAYGQVIDKLTPGLLSTRLSLGSIRKLVHLGGVGSDALKQLRDVAKAGVESEGDDYTEEFFNTTKLFAGQYNLKRASKQETRILQNLFLGAKDIEVINDSNQGLYGGLDIVIGGVTLSDLMSEDFTNRRKVTDGRVIQFLNFFIAQTHSETNMLAEDMLEKDMSAFSRKYPYTFRANIEDMVEMVNGLAILPGLLDLRRIGIKYGLDKVLVETIGRVQAQMIVLASRIREILINPTSDEVGITLSTINNDILGGNINPINFFIMTGASQQVDLIGIYRKLIPNAEAGINPIYTTLLGSIEEVLQESKGWVVQMDDLDEVTTDFKVDDVNREFVLLKNNVQGLQAVSGWKGFVLDEIDIPWEQAGLKKPSSVEIEFIDNNPLQFSLNLGFENDLGESTNLVLKFDAQKQGFDWNILQDPNLYPQHKQRFLMAANLLIQEMQSKAQEKHASKEVPIVRTFDYAKPRIRRTKPVRFSRNVVSGRLQPSNPMQLDFSSIQQQEIRNCIAYFPDQDYGREYDGIPENIKVMIEKKIAEFNEVGRGRFKRLDKVAPDGRAQYSLRMGDYRVLLIQREFEKGKRLFDIRHIGNRNNIYDKVDN